MVGISRSSQTKQCLIVMMMMFTGALAAVPFTDFLDWHCGENIPLSRVPTGSVKLQLTYKGEYSANMDCEVTFHVRDSMRILLTFQYVDIQDVEPCLGDYLQVYDGSWNTPATPAREDRLTSQRFCGAQTPVALASSYSNLTLKFVSDSGKNSRGFAAHLTAFHDGECRESDEFRCNNHRCIDSDLYCDHVDNCGDDSDRCHLLVYVVVCTILLTILLFVAALTLTAVLWYRWKRRVHRVSEEPVAPHNHTDYIFTIAEGAHVVSMLLSQLMPAGPQAMNWTTRHTRPTS